jgi:hypothetical protein
MLWLKRAYGYNPDPLFPSPTIEAVTTSLANPQVQSVVASRAVKGTSAAGENRRVEAGWPIRIFHLASLDAPTVAVVWALAFAWAAHVHLPLWAPVALWLVAWTLYIADRLLDARAAVGSASAHCLRDRHQFHWRHREILVPLAAVAAVAAAVLVFLFMPAISVERNTILAAATVAYFTGVHSNPSPTARRLLRFRRIPKELHVGLLFTAGCALPAWTRLAGVTEAWPWLVSVGYFVLLGWLNCQCIECWESAGESRAKKREILFPASLLAVAGVILAVLLFSTQPRPAAVLIAGGGSAVLLALLDRFRNRLSPLTLRAAADLVLLTPLALMCR